MNALRIVLPPLALLPLLALGACAMSSVIDAPLHPVSARSVLDPLLTRRNSQAGILSVHRDIDTASNNCRHRIYLDGNAVADLRSNEVVHIYAPPGAHLLRVEPNGSGCSGGAHEMAAVSTPGVSQSFKTAVSSGSLLMSAAD